MSPFKEKVIQIIRSVPEGKVVSYGQVALYAGLPRAARQVGWILNGCEGKVALPWWRVINNTGRITIDGTMYNSKELQARLLREEGVSVVDLQVPIETFRYRPTEKELQEYKLPASYIQKLIEKYGV